MNSSSVQLAMYPFLNCRFALRIRTRSLTTNIGLPPPSRPYSRCQTASWFISFTIDGAMPKLRWYVLLYDHTTSRNLSRYLTVWCLVKYRHMRVFSVRLNLSTILAFVSSLCVEKWWTPFSFNNAWKERFRNSNPLSVCKVTGLILDNNYVNAATNDDADLFFSGMHYAHFENTSFTVSKNVIPSLSFSSLIRRRNRLATVHAVLPLRHNAV